MDTLSKNIGRVALLSYLEKSRFNFSMLETSEFTLRKDKYGDAWELNVFLKTSTVWALLLRNRFLCILSFTIYFLTCPILLLYFKCWEGLFVHAFCLHWTYVLLAVSFGPQLLMMQKINGVFSSGVMIIECSRMCHHHPRDSIAHTTNKLFTLWIAELITLIFCIVVFYCWLQHT